MSGLVIVAVLGVCGTALWATPDVTVESPKAALVALRTEDFENGTLKITDVSAGQLETFLQDLNRRKDYDASQHDGKLGPDGEYLWPWVQAATKELLRRGYGIDDQGRLHRAGDVVPWR